MVHNRLRLLPFEVSKAQLLEGKLFDVYIDSVVT